MRNCIVSAGCCREYNEALTSADFSLRGLVLASPNPHSLKPALLKAPQHSLHYKLNCVIL
jgi:hypothetical protein